MILTGVVMGWVVTDSDHPFCDARWSEHHVLTDGWSMPLLMQDAVAYYDASRSPGIREVLNFSQASSSRKR